MPACYAAALRHALAAGFLLPPMKKLIMPDDLCFGAWCLGEVEMARQIAVRRYASGGQRDQAKQNLG